MAQLNSASDFGSEGWGFESLHGHYEHKTCNFIAGFCYLEKIEVKNFKSLENNKKYKPIALLVLYLARGAQ